MKSTNLIFWLSIVVLLLSCQAADSEILDQDNFVNDPAKFETVFGNAAEAVGVTSAALVYQESEGRVLTAYHGDDVDENSLFQAASLSKAVAAITVLILAEQKDIGIDEDIQDYTPSLDWDDINPSGEAVTLRALLSHTAGASVSGFAGYRRGKPLPHSVDIVHGKNTAFHGAVKIGPSKGRFQYSGGGYQIAQVFAEDVSGKPFSAVARSLLLEPLGMDKSTFVQPIDPERISPLRIAGARSPIRPQEGIFWPRKNTWHNYPEQAAAGLWTTPEDYGMFLQAVMDAYHGQQSPIPQSVAKDTLTVVDKSYGLGFLVKQDDRGEGVGISHSGANMGYRSFFKAEIKTGRYAVIMTNSPGGSRLGKDVVEALFPE